MRKFILIILKTTYHTQVIILVAVLLLSSCSSKPQKPRSEDAVVKVYDKELTAKDIEAVNKTLINRDDSTEIINNFIQQWVIDELLYNKAKAKYKDDLEIESKVREFRRSLVLKRYKNFIANQKNVTPSDSAVFNFYTHNKSQFILEEPILKGAFVSVTNNSPNITMLRKAIRNLNDKAIEEIDKYSLKNPINHIIFNENWVKLSDIKYMLPKDIITKLETSNIKPQIYETKDSLFRYILSVSDVKNVNDTIPYKMAKEQIIYILKEQNKTNSIEQHKRTILLNAKKKGNVIYY